MAEVGDSEAMGAEMEVTAVMEEETEEVEDSEEGWAVAMDLVSAAEMGDSAVGGMAADSEAEVTVTAADSEVEVAVTAVEVEEEVMEEVVEVAERAAGEVKPRRAEDHLEKSFVSACFYSCAFLATRRFSNTRT